jgi:hypothetical protein
MPLKMSFTADEKKWQSPKYRSPYEHSFMSGLEQCFLPVLICVHLRPSAIRNASYQIQAVCCNFFAMQRRCNGIAFEFGMPGLLILSASPL